jgi:endonuclease/exonuclease/phosphatase (EEP) superfamily protein YafD
VSARQTLTVWLVRLGGCVFAAQALLIGVRLTGADRPGFLPTLYAVFPYILFLSFPLIALYNLLSRYGMATLFGVVGLFALHTISPAVFGNPVAVPAGTPRLSVLFANMWDNNPDPSKALRSVLTTKADIYILTEFHVEQLTADDRDLLNALFRTQVVDKTDFVILTELDAPRFRNFSTGFSSGSELLFNIEDRDVTVFAVHPPAPNKRESNAWFSGLLAITRQIPTFARNTMVIGDFNTTRWQPGYQRILDLGYRDAHDELGEGLTTSWPVRGHRYPPFVRIDHALVSAGVEPQRIADVNVPGGDHDGFILEVALTG